MPKISQLNIADELSGSEEMIVVQSGETKKISISSASSHINSDVIKSATSGIPGALSLTNIVSIGQSEYEALELKNPSTLYIIT